MDYDDLYRWIDEHTISRQKRNISRDFSDAMPLAEILKQHYPKLVELHNYSPQNSMSQKLSNWQTLNKRVLQKIGITLNNEQIEQLAKALPGCIEKLLLEIKTKVELKDNTDKSSSINGKVYYLEGFSNTNTNPNAILPIKIRNGSRILDEKMVPAEIFNNMEKDLSEKNLAVKELTKRVEHLESLVGLKDERIKDLTQQLQNLINEYNSASLTSPRTKFFKRIF